MTALGIKVSTRYGIDEEMTMTADLGSDRIFNANNTDTSQV